MFKSIVCIIYNEAVSIATSLAGSIMEPDGLSIHKPFFFK